MRNVLTGFARWLPAVGVAIAALGSASAQAQDLYLNEIYASHASTDDQEFIELYGTGGASLDDIMVLIVEGDGGGAGNLDRAWDLSGNVMPGDGYFVLGVDAVANNDFNIGTDNQVENGTETIYLLAAANVGAVTSLLGSDLDSDNDGVYDAGLEISGLGTILDVVAMVDSGYGSGDQVYDGATVVWSGRDVLPGRHLPRR